MELKIYVFLDALQNKIGHLKKNISSYSSLMISINSWAS